MRICVSEYKILILANMKLWWIKKCVHFIIMFPGIALMHCLEVKYYYAL